MLTWINKAFQVNKTQGGLMAHLIDGNGVIIFRWRVYYDEMTYEEVNIPFGVIEKFETFTALCRQFETPGDVKNWYMNKLAGR
jgi:hypothetical protein